MTREEQANFELCAEKLLRDEQVVTLNVSEFPQPDIDSDRIRNLIYEYNQADDDTCRFRVGLDRDTIVISRNPSNPGR